MVKLFLALLLFSNITFAVDGGFCPRIEGKRSGTCRAERPGSTCEPNKPCSPAPIIICKEESTFDQPKRNGGTCVAMEDQCVLTPEGRKCEQVCTKWSPGTCTIERKRCCVKFKQLEAVPFMCCGGACVPVEVAGKCGPPPPIPDELGKKLPLCGYYGGC